MEVDKIIEGIKNGKHFTIATSRYEQYLWYKDGKFYSAYEDGIHNSSSVEKTEDYIRTSIQHALNRPREYDAVFEEDW